MTIPSISNGTLRSSAVNQPPTSCFGRLVSMLCCCCKPTMNDRAPLLDSSINEVCDYGASNQVEEERPVSNDGATTNRGLGDVDNWFLNDNSRLNSGTESDSGVEADHNNPEVPAHQYPDMNTADMTWDDSADPPPPTEGSDTSSNSGDWNAVLEDATNGGVDDPLGLVKSNQNPTTGPLTK